MRGKQNLAGSCVRLWIASYCSLRMHRFPLNVLLFTVVLWAAPAFGQPRLVEKLPPRVVGLGGVSMDLTDYFTSRVVRVSTPLGTFNMELLEDEAPLTVANFRAYLHEGAYDSLLIHRSVPGFVIQTGGFSAALPPVAIMTNPPVRNEFGVPNTRGTVAMAKLGGDPDSATSQWFVNLADNRANLDNQNGGFTVFARVLGEGMSVVDALAEVPVYHAGGTFSDLPLRDMRDGQDSISEENLLPIESVRPVLAYSAVSSNPAAWAVRVEGDTLSVLPGPEAARRASVTVRAEDAEGRSVMSSFVVRADRARQYQGLGLSPQGPVFITLTMTPAGSASLVIRTEAGAPRRGRVSLDVRGGGEVVYDTDNGLLLGLSYQAAGDLVTVALDSGDITNFELRPAAWTGRSDSVSPLADRRANVLLDDGAAGYLHLRFGRSGAARVTGRLAVGDRPLTASAPSLASNDPGQALLPLPFFAARGPTASLTGELRVRHGGAPSLVPLTGPLQWRSRDGDAQDLAAVGSFWERPGKNINILTGGLNDSVAFRLSFGVDAAEQDLPADFSAIWPSSNKILLQKGDFVAGLRCHSVTGTISGRVLLEPSAGTKPSTRPFRGVLTGRMDRPAAGFRGAGFTGGTDAYAGRWELEVSQTAP